MRKALNTLMVSFLGIVVVFLASGAIAQIPYTTTKTNDCGAGVGAPRGRDGLRRIADPEGGWQTKGFILDSFGPMPQTAYDPNFGCYPGNARTIHRYPAFHGYHSSSPTNWRHYAEYPWNAKITEPRPYPNNAKPSLPCGSNVTPIEPYDGQVIVLEEATISTKSTAPVVTPEAAAPTTLEGVNEAEIDEIGILAE